MVGHVYDQVAVIDTSAAIALFNSKDEFHSEAKVFFEGSDLVWFAVNITGHELYTHIRYNENTPRALQHYDFIHSPVFRVLTFNDEDENNARTLLEKYNDQDLSFHDALLKVVMIRNNIYKIFSFDHHFWILGLEVVPGPTVQSRKIISF
jgi:uncharacterized protein